MLKKKLIIFKIFINYFINKIKISEKNNKKISRNNNKNKKNIIFYKMIGQSNNT